MMKNNKRKTQSGYAEINMQDLAKRLVMGEPKNISKMTTKEKNLLYERVYNYKSKSEYGLIEAEIQDVLKDYPDCNMEKYNDAMMGNTCMVDDNENIINYHCDVYPAILCGMENRELTIDEWD